MSPKHEIETLTSLILQVTDIPIAHPSCSKQHAAIQYRQITEKNEFGESSTSVKSV